MSLFPFFKIEKLKLCELEWFVWVWRTNDHLGQVLKLSLMTNALSTHISNDSQAFKEKNKSYFCPGLDIQLGQ